MLYNIDINQLAIIQNYPETKLKLNHFAILDAIYKLRDLDWTKRYIINGKEYIWTSTKLLKSQLPLLDVSEKQIKRYILSLVEEGFLQRNESFENPNKMLVNITNKTAKMKVFVDNKDVDKNVQTKSKDIDKNVQQGVQKCTTNVDKNVHHNLNEFNHKEENPKELKNSYKNEIFDEKNNQLSIINNSIIAKQNDFVNQYPEVVDLLDFSLAEVFEENKYTIDEFCKSKNFELIKKEYRMIKRNLPAPKPKNRQTLIEWYKNLGKVQVADNLYMYPYQAIILKLVFNHKYLAKMINHYDNTYFARDSKFKEYTDHYSNIVGWLKTDIEKNISKQGNNQFDRYYYYNWGVDRNEII